MHKTNIFMKPNPFAFSLRSIFRPLTHLNHFLCAVHVRDPVLLLCGDVHFSQHLSSKRLAFPH